MSKQTVNIGTSANDRTGDSLRAAFNKINENFNELYVALGLGDTTLNLGAFTFTGSVLSTDDSTNITIDRPTTVNGEIVVDGDITPKTNFGANLGTPSKRFKDLYLSSNSIDLGGTVISVSGGSLTVGGSSVSSTVDYNNIQNKPTIPADVSDLTDNSNLLSGGTTTGDLTGSVFADDSSVMVDAVNNTMTAQTLTTLGIFGNPTLGLNADVIVLDAQSGNLVLQTTDTITNNFVNTWEVQGISTSIVLTDDGVNSELGLGGVDVVDFGTGNTIDMQGNSVLFDSASIQDFAPGNVYAKSGQFLYVTSIHASGSATNVAFTYDTNINNPRQTFYGKTEFGFNGQTPVIDFDGATINNWTDPNVVNTNDSGGAWITVGGQEATIDNLTVRIANDGLNQIEVQFNYDPNGTAGVSASGDAENSIGVTSLASGNTSWFTVNLITMVGTTKTFTVSDHGYHKVYRGTVVSRNMPDGGPTPGDAYCILERLK